MLKGLERVTSIFFLKLCFFDSVLWTLGDYIILLWALIWARKVSWVKSGKKEQVRLEQGHPHRWLLLCRVTGARGQISERACVHEDFMASNGNPLQMTQQKKNVLEAHWVAPKIGQQDRGTRTRNVRGFLCCCRSPSPGSGHWARPLALGTGAVLLLCHSLLIQSSSESMWLVKVKHVLALLWWERGGDKYLAFCNFFGEKQVSLDVQQNLPPNRLKKGKEGGKEESGQMFIHLRTPQQFWQNAVLTSFHRKGHCPLRIIFNPFKFCLALTEQTQFEKTHW